MSVAFRFDGVIGTWPRRVSRMYRSCQSYMARPTKKVAEVMMVMANMGGEVRTLVDHSIETKLTNKNADALLPHDLAPSLRYALRGSFSSYQSRYACRSLHRHLNRQLRLSSDDPLQCLKVGRLCKPITRGTRDVKKPERIRLLFFG